MLREADAIPPRSTPTPCRGRPAAGRGSRWCCARLVDAYAVASHSLQTTAPQPAVSPRDSGTRGIIVVQVNGLIDPSNASLIKKSLPRRRRRTCIARRLPARRIRRRRRRHDSLVRAVRDSSVPVAAWVGPSGGEARGASALIALATSNVSVAAGAHIGPVVPVDFDNPSSVSVAAATATVTRSIAVAAERATRRGREPSPLGQGRALADKSDRRQPADAVPVHRRARTVTCSTPRRGDVRMSTSTDRRRREQPPECRPTKW